MEEEVGVPSTIPAHDAQAHKITLLPCIDQGESPNPFLHTYELVADRGVCSPAAARVGQTARALAVELLCLGDVAL